MKRVLFVSGIVFIQISLKSQPDDPYRPDFSKQGEIKGMTLVWNDEFNNDGQPDTSSWIFERGFVRNKELQWYHPDNAVCRGEYCLLKAEGRESPIPATHRKAPTGAEAGSIPLQAFRHAVKNNGNMAGLKSGQG